MWAEPIGGAGGPVAYSALRVPATRPRAGEPEWPLSVGLSALAVMIVIVGTSALQLLTESPASAPAPAPRTFPSVPTIAGTGVPAPPSWTGMHRGRAERGGRIMYAADRQLETSQVDEALLRYYRQMMSAEGWGLVRLSTPAEGAWRLRWQAGRGTVRISFSTGPKTRLVVDVCRSCAG